MFSSISYQILITIFIDFLLTRLERIAKAEQLLQQGKVLDEEQRVLLASKKAIEKSVAELFNIKQQLEEVAKLEESNKIEGSGSSTSATAPAVDAKQEVNASAEEEIVEATPDADDLQDYGNEQVAEADFKEKFNEFIERLIKALHVYERYTHVTSQQLPDTVMYFGRTLLGLTSISSFQDTLNNSIRVAGFYLHVSRELLFHFFFVFLFAFSDRHNHILVGQRGI